MADDTSIEWTRPPWVRRGATWNMIGGCARISPGCEHCWAERDTARFAMNPATPRFKGLAQFLPSGEARWSREVRPFPDKLAEPLRWREPRGVFVCSKSDLFHDDVPNEFIAAVFGVMAACPQHTFFVLTKRPARAAEWFHWVARRGEQGRSLFPGDSEAWRIGQLLTVSVTRLSISLQHPDRPWPLPNVWIGATVEDQQRAEERLPHLLQIPASVRFVSAEPLLEALDLWRWLGPKDPGVRDPRGTDGIDWLIVGGESGPGARPFDLAWAESLRDQCGVAFFMKQIGSNPILEPGPLTYPSSDPKGGDPAEWPADLRVRQFPEVRR